MSATLFLPDSVTSHGHPQPGNPGEETTPQGRGTQPGPASCPRLPKSEERLFRRKK